MSNEIQGGSFSIATFCKRNEISRALFYKLDNQGKAPRTFKVGRRRLMTLEAEREWLEKMQSAAA